MIQNQRKRSRIRQTLQYGMALAAMLFVCIGMKQSAAAEDVLLKVSQVMIYAGDRVELKDYVNEEYQKDVSYAWDGETPDPALAVMTEDGTVRSKAVGEVRVRVTWQDAKENPREEVLYLSMIAPEELSMEYGSKINLEAADLYEKQEITYQADVDSVLVSEKGILTAQGFRDTKIEAVRADGTSFTVANVTILEPKLAKDTIVRAVGTKGYQVEIQYFSLSNGAESIQWKIADQSIAVWDAQGCQARKKGSTTADVVLTAQNGDQKTLKVNIIVTDPSLSVTSIIMAAGTSQKIKVSGTHTASEIVWGNHAGDHAYFSSDGVIYASDAGTSTLKVTVDGKELTCKVQVSDPGYRDLTVIMYKGQAKKLSLTGTLKKSKISFASANKKILTISNAGKMKAKKTGHATVKVTADGKSFSILAEISSKKGYLAMKKAIAISKTKTKYSQAKRMSKGYYDCSSMVSRVYRNYGVYFGSRRGWSPVAANIGQWCVRHHKVVAYKAVSYKKLLPGDLIFFSSQRNGRYKNITHVEMYTGGATDVSASSRYNKVVHYGYSRSEEIVLIARPTK